jgi:hypothetical protein
MFDDTPDQMIVARLGSPLVIGYGDPTLDGRFEMFVGSDAVALAPFTSRITARGVPCFQGSCSEVYLERAFDGTGWRPEPRLPIAKELGETSLMFLVHPTLTNGEMEKTAAVLSEVLGLAQRG